ncbi:MAG: hypothetical protein JSW10_10840 [Pseudomonadota bacterium]|nr:MAG: hypothetical protein JSW10_10840 [Pseudomonadota bacterium]
MHPFLGVTQIVRTPVGRASSVDGTGWQLRVRVAVPQLRWSVLDRPRSAEREVLFGAWSAHDGLVRVPLNPAIDHDQASERADSLLAALASCHDKVPFSRADNYELWLLDKEDALPLALLLSATEEPPPSPDWPLHWHASRRDENGFATAESRERLIRLVSARAGHPPCAQWVQRDAGGGSGLHGVGLAGPLRARRLPAEVFPGLTLREQWPEEDDRTLVQDYLEWLAPYLLMLSEMDDAVRDRLEHAARRRALAVEQCHRLYPRILNPELIESARVEAMMRRSSDA